VILGVAALALLLKSPWALTAMFGVAAFFSAWFFEAGREGILQSPSVATSIKTWSALIVAGLVVTWGPIRVNRTIALAVLVYAASLALSVPLAAAQAGGIGPLFSGMDGAAPCPTLTNVAPMLNNFPPIDTAYPVPTTAILDDTPTGESIDAAANILRGVMDPGPKVIVLATDGEPDTCATPDPQTPQAKEVAVKAAQDAFSQGIFTFYISVGNEVSDVHATEMANVGQGFPRNDPMQRFYRANDQAALASAFATIVEGVRNCSFQLSGTVKNGDEVNGVVTLDGAIVPYNMPDGWILSSPSTVLLQGKACATVKDKNDHKIKADFPCGSIIPFKPPA